MIMFHVNLAGCTLNVIYGFWTSSRANGDLSTGWAEVWRTMGMETWISWPVDRLANSGGFWWKCCWKRTIRGGLYHHEIKSLKVMLNPPKMRDMHHQNHDFCLLKWTFPYHPWDWCILPTWMVDFYGFHVGKYTVRPMDGILRQYLTPNGSKWWCKM